MQHWYFFKIPLIHLLWLFCCLVWSLFVFYRTGTNSNSKQLCVWLGISIVIITEISPLNVGNAATVKQWTYAQLHLTRWKLRFEGFFSWSLLKIQWVKTFSHRCQLIVTAAMNFVPLLQMEFLLDTGSCCSMVIAGELNAGFINKLILHMIIMWTADMQMK